MWPRAAWAVAGGGKVAKEPNIGSFAADTAAKSGRSLASVKADATRAKRLERPSAPHIGGRLLQSPAYLRQGLQDMDRRASGIDE
jgi:hypothetical protein